MYKILSIPKILCTVPFLDYQLTTRDLALQVRKLLRAYTVKTIFLVDWVAYEAVMQYSVRSSSFATGTVLDEKSNNLLPFLFRRTALNYYCPLYYSNINGNLLSTSIVFEFDVHALISA